MIETKLDIETVRRWKRYSSYSECKLETLVTLPTHWHVTRLKHVTAINPEVLTDSTDPNYEIAYVDIGNVDSLGRIHELQSMRFEHAPSRARRIVRHGDVIISTVRTYLKAIAAIEYPPENMIVSTGFAVLRANSGCHPRYLSRLIQSKEFVDIVVNHSEGVGYPAINPNELGTLAVWLPPEKEQKRIAAFLDQETFRIEQLVERKERLISLMVENLQSVTSRTIGCGLNRDIRMKNSGIEWIPSIPEHWTTRRVKFLFSQSVLPVREDDGVVTAYRDGQVTLRENRRTEGYTFAFKEIGYQGVRRGQVVVNSMDAFAGAIGVSESDGKCTPEYVVCDPRSNEIIPEYFAQCLREMARNNFVEISCNAVRERAPRLRFSILAEMWLPVPPHIEQVEIAEHIHLKKDEFRKQVAVLNRSIGLLKEYRAALISAAVTGQIDVREEL